MTVGHLVHLHIHGDRIRVEVGLVALSIESDQDVAQNVGAKGIVHLSHKYALMQAIAKSFEKRHVCVDLLPGNFFVDAESASSRQSSCSRRQNIIVARDTSGLWREIGIRAL